MRASSLLLSTLLATATLSAPLLAPTVALAATAEEATSYVTRIGNDTLATLNDASLNPAAVKSKLEALFNKEVDVDWVSKFVMGRSWRDLTPAQQTQYQKIYRQFLIEHYTSNFVEYTKGTTFKVTRAVAMPRDEQQVGMDIVRPGQAPVKAEYRIRGTGADLKIVDIAVEGVSLTTTQRQEFASVMQRYGFDYLIQQLQARLSAEQAKTQNVTAAK